MTLASVLTYISFFYRKVLFFLFVFYVRYFHFKSVKKGKKAFKTWTISSVTQTFVLLNVPITRIFGNLNYFLGPLEVWIIGSIPHSKRTVVSWNGKRFNQIVKGIASKYFKTLLKSINSWISLSKNCPN